MTLDLVEPHVFYGVIFLIALGVSLLATGIVLFACRRWGWVPAPSPGRWADTPRPIMGGVGIFSAFVLVLGSSLLWHFYYYPVESYSPSFLAALFGGGAIVFISGLWDDIAPLAPPVKLLMQIIPACLAAGLGMRIFLLGHPLVDIPLTIFWFVGITNAFNLLDNMDGLSAGIASLSALLLFLYSLGNWPLIYSLSLVVLCGAGGGFLVYNFKPARIFMGDSGSQFLGYTLGLLALGGAHQNDINGLLAPLLVLVVPILDTTLVVILRWFHGRGIFTGGTDHLSHRLVAMGMSERKAVLLLYLITVAIGGILLFSRWIDQFVAWIMAALSLVVLFYFSFFISEVKVYPPAPKVRSKWRGRVKSYGFYIALILLDVVMITTAFISSYLIRFDWALPDKYYEVVFRSLPLFIVVKISTFIFMGLYQKFSRHVQFEHFKKITQASFLGSLISVLLATMIWRFIDFSRAVFVIDWALTVILIALSRSLFRIFRDFFWTAQDRPKVALVGNSQVLLSLEEDIKGCSPEEISLIFALPRGEKCTLETTIEVVQSWEEWKDKVPQLNGIYLILSQLASDELDRIREDCTLHQVEVITFDRLLAKGKVEKEGGEINRSPSSFQNKISSKF